MMKKRGCLLVVVSALFLPGSLPFQLCIHGSHLGIPSGSKTLHLRSRIKLGERTVWRTSRMMAEDGQERTKSSALNVSFPTPDEGAAMGIREWPGFLKKTEDFEEEVDVGTTRYILEGTGSCTPAGESRIDLEPGTLMECTRPTTLSWKIASPMVILTPKFEQAKLFAGFAVAIFGGLAYLIANASDKKAVPKRASVDDEDD